ncbi:MAG: AAA family ATPase, partial [Cellulomonas sp.]|nr:AAA family ATPase [Cellulomonas sp.]
VEGPAFQPYLSGRDNLVRPDACDPSADPATRDARLDRALGRVGLGAAAGKRYRQYSLGMKQRLGLAGALLRPRRLLVLDEPTNGLDPQGTREVRHLVRELAAEGTTVLVSSHLLAEIDQVCTHLGIMSAGRLVLQGERSALAEHRAVRVLVRVRPDQSAQARALLTGLGLDQVSAEGDELGAVLGTVEPAAVSATLVHAGVDLLGLQVLAPTLEQVFVELTGEGFDVAR